MIMFDMTQCKIGDKLVTRDGKEVMFFKVDPANNFPYLVINGEVSASNARCWTYTADGYYYPNQENPKDIIGFAQHPLAAPEAPSEDTEEVITKSPKITIVAKPSFVLSIAGKDVELTLEELKDLGATIINLIGEE
jgi:hypothetical protein